VRRRALSGCDKHQHERASTLRRPHAPRKQGVCCRRSRRSEIVPCARLLCALLGLIAHFLKQARESQSATELLLAQLENARDEQARAAATAERNRIASELHDVLAHSLSGVAMDCGRSTSCSSRMAAAAAIDEAWRALRPDDVVEQLDLVKFFSPLHRKIHSDGYVKLVEHAPELWGMLFGKTDHPKVARRLIRLRSLRESGKTGNGS